MPWVLGLWLAAGFEPGAIGGTLSGSFTPIAQGSNANLTTEGALDWVHWGLETDTSVNRKASVTPKISNFTVLYNTTTSYQGAYRYADNYNGYSWADGFPTEGVTNTITGVYVLRPFSGTDVNGFQFTVPADTATNILKVYLGTFATRGKFQATLSDGSAPAYTDTSLNNTAAATNAVYTITFAAASSGQTLTIRWTVNTPVIGSNFQANVTLQGAALTATGADNPPYSIIASPAGNAAFTAPGDITIDARAFDPDGSVTNLGFYAGATKLQEVTGANLTNASFTWSGAPPGDHFLTVRVTDNAGTTSVSAPVEVFVNGTGGFLSGTTAPAPAGVNLSTEGTVDWTHWGLLTATTLNRKAGVTPRISDFMRLGTNTVQRLSDSRINYSWTDGTPTSAATSSNGVFIFGLTNGFELTVPADTAARTLKVYVSLYGAQGNLQAFLSDFSAPAYTDTSISDGLLDNAYAVHSISFAAASPGQTLTVRWTAKNLFDWAFGNVSLQAATLAGGNLPPLVVLTNPPANALFSEFASVALGADTSDPDGTVSKVEFFQGANKLGEATSVPYTLIWSNAPVGSYLLTARAIDNQGETKTSAAVPISVIAVTFLSLSVVNGEAGFSFATDTNRAYTVESTDSLTPVSWQPLTNFQGSGSVTSYIDPNSPGLTNRFYRIRVQ